MSCCFFFMCVELFELGGGTLCIDGTDAGREVALARWRVESGSKYWRVLCVTAAVARDSDGA